VDDLEGTLDGWLDSFEHYEYPTVTVDEMRGDSPQLDAMRGLGYVK
jgi:hypothetical protein